jgi:hypothetical protein
MNHPTTSPSSSSPATPSPSGPAAVEPFPHAGAWSAGLRGVSSSPLECCPGFPRIAKRFEAWWNHDCLDRPVFLGQKNADPSRPITRRLELLGDPDAWFAARLLDMRQMHHAGDSIANIRIDFGPVMLGALLGADVAFDSDTTWTHAFIEDDWSNAPRWEIDADNPYWQLLGKLLDRVAADAAGRYLVCAPDLGGSADLLLNLRGSGGLCTDAIEQPKRIIESIDAIYPLWRRSFSLLYDTVTRHRAGLFSWLHLWSDVPYVVPACDFNYMIGPETFRDICLPDIARQAAAAGRAVFHLDGPGAARHIESLLELPQLQAIQFTPGEGTPSVLPWLKMLRRIQQAGKSFLIFCPIDQLKHLIDEVPPEGMAVTVTGARSPQHLDEAYESFCRRYGPAGNE